VCSSDLFGSYNELTFNPSGPTFQDGRLNPFSDAKIREAMNWLIDRDYIAQEIFGGLAVPKYTSLNSSFADYARYVDTARQLEAYYAYDPAHAEEVVTTEMEAMGATREPGGVWMFDGAPVTIILIIRTEDARKEIGDYFASQLESIGFTVDRQYKTRSEASPIWNQSDPTEGQWHVYTGGWITTAISRDDGTNFGYFYTPLGSGSPLWQAYVNTPEYTDIATRLWTNDFASMEERGQLFARALVLANQEGQRLWVVDQISFSPQRANLQVTYDLAGGVAGAALWPFTIRFTDQEGGTVRWAQPGVLVEPWNPLGGSNWIYDQSPERATADTGVVPDPYTGLAWPLRIDHADVVAQTGLPIAQSLDWVTLTFADQIDVPADAWADWDATTQTFITVGTKYPDGVTSLIKVTVYYPDNLFSTVRWHDGSKLSVADFIMNMILTFDPGNSASAIYDESAVPTLEAFMSHFVAVRIVSTDPLVIETYDNLYNLDAENNVNIVTAWWPTYTYGTGSWHAMALGVQAEAAGQLTFTSAKADALQVEWMSFIGGPSLDILAGYLGQDVESGYIPYAPTMGQYVTAREAKTRYSNLQDWYTAHGHLWVGTGPFYLDAVYPVEGTLTLTRYADYAGEQGAWDRFSSPQIAFVELTGPNSVVIGDDATFDVSITYNGSPYPAAEISGVKFLVFDSTGALASTGEATFVADGQYQVVVPTTALTAGSNRIEVAVTSTVVSIPSFASFEFVTTNP